MKPKQKCDDSIYAKLLASANADVARLSKYADKLKAKLVKAEAKIRQMREAGV